MAGFFKATLLVKLDCSAICCKHVHVKSSMDIFESFNNTRSDAFAVVFRQHEKVGVINNQKPVRYGISQPH